MVPGVSNGWTQLHKVLQSTCTSPGVAMKWIGIALTQSHTCNENGVIDEQFCQPMPRDVPA